MRLLGPITQRSAGCCLRAFPGWLTSTHPRAFPPRRPQANEFQAQCKKLPLALRDWAAYKDCRRTIDDFLDLLPLFQALAHKSIRDRWAGAGGAVAEAQGNRMSSVGSAAERQRLLPSPPHCLPPPTRLQALGGAADHHGPPVQPG